MWTCKQVSKCLAEQDYESLPTRKKLMLKFHVAICAVCGKYNKQVMVMQDAVRTFRQHEEAELEDDSPDSPHLSDDRKSRLKEALKSHQGCGCSGNDA